MMQPQRPRPRKEAMFVRLQAPDETIAFHNASAHIGKKMPFSNPLATCAMRVNSEVVSFNLSMFTKKASKAAAEKELEINRGAFSRLERRASALNTEKEITPEDLVVELSTGIGEEMKNEVSRFKLERDTAGELSVETLEDQEDESFVLPRGSVKVSLYTRSAGTNRLLAVAFTGFLGKPESTETVRRVVSMVLSNLSNLAEFKVLSGIESVNIPANSARHMVRPTRKPTQKAEATFVVNLFNAETQPVANGTMHVEVDLVNANPTSGLLLFNLTPSEELVEPFEEYREIIESTLSTHLRSTLGDEDISSITYDIVLGDLSDETITRIREALTSVNGFAFSPTQYQTLAN